ncbi:RlmE family RNA methyltransferase [Temperatibacter marinus]|uniref:Ribosomal RNA large subunit methyltransferase E n=1 Tax=Temperatibacter marinus TaxID=1456591 RepID=A0AA52EFH7_9PROT|nr:RlmE family RNA methyltransferase [Temperatibacter marinus]WND02163.1 RlmE family RNA methyltransferase [Temperatibacter marinus]
MTKKSWSSRQGNERTRVSSQTESSALGDTRSRARGENKVRVKTARGRTTSSQRWLQRQLNDPYVAEANRLGYRSRAAFKLKEIDDKYDILSGARRIVDLGCAPGGWTQYICEKLAGKAQIIGIDLQEVEPIQGAKMWVKDFMDPDAEHELMAELEGPADVVLSDMANASTGHKQTDHLKTIALAEAALDFAIKVLVKDGHFAAKILQGGSDKVVVDKLNQHFHKVRHFKPPSSRQGSTEWFVVAQGFKGRKDPK